MKPPPLIQRSRLTGLVVLDKVAVAREEVEANNRGLRVGRIRRIVGAHHARVAGVEVYSEWKVNKQNGGGVECKNVTDTSE